MSHTQKVICQSCLFSLRHFAALYFRILHSKQRENEQIVNKRESEKCIYKYKVQQVNKSTQTL